MNAALTQRIRWLFTGLLLLALRGWACAADDAQTRVLGNWLTQSKGAVIQISQAADGT